jgi:hypothetical protein
MRELTRNEGGLDCGPFPAGWADRHCGPMGQSCRNHQPLPHRADAPRMLLSYGVVAQIG